MTKSTYSGLGVLARQFAKQIIWEIGNTHTSSTLPNIALVGSRRSGSTLLMQVIGQSPGVKWVNQPFSHYVASAHQMQFVPWPAGGLFVHPTAHEVAQIHRYLEAIFGGSLHVQEPWRFWLRDFHFRSNRIVMKLTEEHYLVPIFRKLGCRIVRYFRHPIPQALSCLRNQWGDKVDHFAKSGAFLEEVLTAEQRSFFQSTSRSGTPLQRYVLGWACENLPLFQSNATDELTVFYERIVLEPDTVLLALVQFCELADTGRMRQVLTRASASVRGLSESSTEEAIRRGDTSEVVARWQRLLSVEDIAAVQRVLDRFPGCPYRASEPMPVTAPRPLADTAVGQAQ